jgi:hypothetical protein
MELTLSFLLWINLTCFLQGIQQGIIEGEFALCISLYHGYELLQQMGMRSLYFFLSGIMDGTKGKL